MPLRALICCQRRSPTFTMTSVITDDEWSAGAPGRCPGSVWAERVVPAAWTKRLWRGAHGVAWIEWKLKNNIIILFSGIIRKQLSTFGEYFLFFTRERMMDDSRHELPIITVDCFGTLEGACCFQLRRFNSSAWRRAKRRPREAAAAHRVPPQPPPTHHTTKVSDKKP